MADFMQRIAGAPITWGVDGSPGWGHLMDRDRVLDEMQTLGLGATELGPDGYLPTDAASLQPMLAARGLSLIGGFIPLILYRPDMIDDQLAYAERAAATLAGAGSNVLVLGPDSHFAGYDEALEIDEAGYAYFFDKVEQVTEISASHGLVAALHPHWGMAIETNDQVERFLESCDTSMCLDTGHLHLGGADPVAIAKLAGDRVAHVHLKDVDVTKGELVRSRQVPFRDAVVDGLFTPLGEGAVDIAGVIRHLESIGYDGWYVLEQDLALSAPPAEGEGPITDQIRSMEFLAGIDL